MSETPIAESVQRVELPTVWPADAGAVPPVTVNCYGLQRNDEHSVILTFGWAGMPMLSGSIEEQQAAAQSLDGVQIRVVARLLVSNRDAENIATGMLSAVQVSGQIEEGGPTE